MRRPAAIALCLVALAAAPARAQQPAAQPAAAQPSPLKRTVLQTKPLTSAPGHDGILVLAELAVGGSAPRHMHPGEEFVYVLQGTGTFDMQGQPTLTIQAGDSFVIPANTPHVAKNTGNVPVKLLSTYVLESGKPLAIPVP
jgi:quercetin dioxygenase-like cupin family protein